MKIKQPPYYLLALATLPLISSHAQEVTKHPNIIHIILDDVAYDDLSAYGCPDIKTPNMDLLAKEGMSFTNFYAPHATSSPSRAAMLTGRYAPRINENEGISVLFPASTNGLDSKKEITLAEILQQQGYLTALYGKWHLGHLAAFLPPNQGFDYFLGIPYPNDHGPERVNGTGIHPMGEWPPIPLIRDLETIKNLDNNDLAEAPGLFQRAACRFIKRMAKTGRPFYLQYANIETHTPYFIPRGFEGRSNAGAYGDALAYTDLTVQAIVETVKKSGIEENTLIVISSDNGPLIGYDPELYRSYGRYGYVDSTRQHKLREGKYQMWYDGGPRVVCMMKWPGKIPAGTKNNDITTGADLFSTFIKIAGAKIPSDRVIDGKDITPLMFAEKNAKKPHEVFYYFRGHDNRIYALRKGVWKLVLAGKRYDGKYHQAELYQLDNDPGETKNRIADQPEIAAELNKLANKALENIQQNKALDF